MNGQQLNIDLDLLIKWLGRKELEAFFLQQQIESLKVEAQKAEAQKQEEKQSTGE